MQNPSEARVRRSQSDYSLPFELAVRGAGTQAVGTVHYSDRGCQYASDAYQAALNKDKLRCSMTDGYGCYQNALTE